VTLLVCPSSVPQTSPSPLSPTLSRIVHGLDWSHCYTCHSSKSSSLPSSSFPTCGRPVAQCRAAPRRDPAHTSVHALPPRLPRRPRVHWGAARAPGPLARLPACRRAVHPRAHAREPQGESRDVSLRPTRHVRKHRRAGSSTYPSLPHTRQYDSPRSSGPVDLMSGSRNILRPRSHHHSSSGRFAPFRCCRRGHRRERDHDWDGAHRPGLGSGRTRVA
jgi:hypothetical protein